MNPTPANVNLTPFLSEQAWDAVLQRDPAADGRFYYAVTTTGVYCRPSCPSKRPRRENVLFFDSVRSAEAAGYRACRRCGMESERIAAERIERACRTIEEAEQAPSLDRLAAGARLTRHHFLRVFTKALGMTPGAYYRWQQRRRLEQGLSRGDSVDSAIYGAGYGSPSRVYGRAAELLGMTPSVYRQGAPRQSLRYGFTETEFGLLAVAATQHGICAIEFGRNRRQLASLLKDRFPKAELIESDPQLDAWISKVAAHVAQPAQPLSLPLDVRGTAFQKRVWDALQKVPAGSTVSYTQLAQALGQPKAVRAVAQACARNPAAVLIPCHRAVGADGSLRGYRWGRSRKSRLLAKEKKATSSASPRTSSETSPPSAPPRTGNTTVRDCARNTPGDTPRPRRTRPLAQAR
jgi:AraC family transcriptional regulator of adaptative response/methylated-DNA-[protein]-cysteine methyltransferase